MSPDRIIRVAHDKALEHEIGEYFWEYMDSCLAVQDHFDVPTYDRNVATYHIYLRFGVKVKWEELMYLAYH